MILTALLGPRARVALVILAAACIQGPVVDRIQVARAHADLLLLLPVMAGLVGGPQQGAWVGFLSGFVADLSLPTALGLSALVFTITGFVAGQVVQALIEGPWWVAPLTGAVGSAVGVVLYVLVATATGQALVLKDPLVLATVLGVVSVGNAVLSLPVRAVLQLAMGDRDSEAALR